MNIYDYAMQLERDGEKFYLEASRSTANTGLSAILCMLASAERIHYRIFDKMKREEKIIPSETAILKDAKNVFVKMKDEGGWQNMSISEKDLYRKAQEIEKMTEDFYLQKAEELKGQPQEAIFRQIAGEERKHFMLLQNIIDFVSRPETWLENAEWYHLDEY